jgi:hypothetical protein
MSDPLHDEYSVPIDGYNSVHHYVEAKCLPYPDHLLQCLTTKELKAVGTYNKLQSEKDQAAFLLEAFRWYISDYYGYRIPDQRVFDATLANRLVALYKQGGFPVRCIFPSSDIDDAERRTWRHKALELKFQHPECLKALVLATPEEILRYTPSGIHMMSIRNRTLRNTIVSGLKEKTMESDSYGFARRLAQWSRVDPDLLEWYKRQVLDSWKAVQKSRPNPDLFETQEILAQLYGSWVLKIQIVGCVEPLEVVARVWTPILAQEKIPPRLARISTN